MKKLSLIFVLIGLSFNLQAVSKEQKTTLQKTKAILTSKQACAIYSLIIGASAGAGGMFLIKEMLSKKALQALQEEQKKIWRPGSEVAQNVQENHEKVIKRYFDFDENTYLSKMVIYTRDPDTKGRKAFAFDEKLFMDTLAKDLEKEVNQAHQNNITIEITETKAFSKIKQYSDAFEKLYHDMCKYNDYLLSNNKKVWDVELEKMHSDKLGDLVGAIYINPPSES